MNHMLPRGSEFQHPQEACTTELIKLPCLVMRVRAQSLFTSASDLGSVQMSHCESTPCVISSSQVQGPEHPSPGQPYSAHNFPRQAYLPDTPDGCRFSEMGPFNCVLELYPKGATWALFGLGAEIAVHSRHLNDHWPAQLCHLE